MENIRNAVAAVCAVAAVRCIAGNIAGSARLKNQLMMLLDLTLGAVMIAPFASGCSRIELPELRDYELVDYGGTAELYDAALVREIASNIADVLGEQLTAAGIPWEKIVPEVNISADGGISINRVTVTAGDPAKAAEIIKNSLGSGTEVEAEAMTGGEENGDIQQDPF